MNSNICNICGANYEYINGKWKCRYCGSYKPEEITNEESTLLYIANQRLRMADFDEAEKQFTDIIEKFPKSTYAYWGRLLAKYGIKYEDDFDGRKIPTCYATSMECFTSDSDYLKALDFADADTKEFYQKQAGYIEKVRKEWVEKAKKEKPYDIFICYKDSDLTNGIDRTPDSIAAQEIYIHLVEQGYRVFYSRESLRDKIGEKYEPYIFNALSTAKVMLVYGSSAEYITSTWLKNEWMRYEKRIKNGEKDPSSLIVACDGFSPSELPRMLATKQCLDANRRTFYIDLDKCISHIIKKKDKTARPNRLRPLFAKAESENNVDDPVKSATAFDIARNMWGYWRSFFGIGRTKADKVRYFAGLTIWALVAIGGISRLYNLSEVVHVTLYPYCLLAVFTVTGATFVDTVEKVRKIRLNRADDQYVRAIPKTIANGLFVILDFVICHIYSGNSNNGIASVGIAVMLGMWYIITTLLSYFPNDCEHFRLSRKLPLIPRSHILLGGAILTVVMLLVVGILVRIFS